jgi:hypothetical protein
LLSGTEQSAWSFGPFVIGVLAPSVLVTPMFNAARGSLLIPALFHFQMNGPAWPDTQPWENYVFAIAAVAVVLLNWKAMLTRDQAVTEGSSIPERDPAPTIPMTPPGQRSNQEPARSAQRTPGSACPVHARLAPSID